MAKLTVIGIDIHANRKTWACTGDVPKHGAVLTLGESTRGETYVAGSWSPRETGGFTLKVTAEPYFEPPPQTPVIFRDEDVDLDG